MNSGLTCVSLFSFAVFETGNHRLVDYVLGRELIFPSDIEISLLKLDSTRKEVSEHSEMSISLSVNMRC